MMRLWLTFICIIGLLAPQSAVATGTEPWVGFYKLAKPEAVQQPAPFYTGVCAKAILEAQTRYGIPDNLLLAIGLQEAGRRVNDTLTIWPWTANSQGKGVFFGSKQALEAWVRETQGTGIRSIDVGCMQINQRWHAEQFSSLEQATDPVANVDYAARFLRSLYAETRDWWQAAGRYHSSTESYKAIYLDKLKQNQRLALANLGYFAAMSDQGSQIAVASAASSQLPSINWSSAMTGATTLNVGDALSIYSAKPMRSVLPNYEVVE